MLSDEPLPITAAHLVSICGGKAENEILREARLTPPDRSGECPVAPLDR
jgi:hypothetical protein